MATFDSLAPMQAHALAPVYRGRNYYSTVSPAPFALLVDLSRSKSANSFAEVPVVNYSTTVLPLTSALDGSTLSTDVPGITISSSIVHFCNFFS